MILPSVPFEMVMGSNAFFMFFNYKYKNTKLIFFYFQFFHLSHCSSKSSPGIFREKKWEGREKSLGSRLILSLSYIRVILTFCTVITTSFPSLLPTSNSPKIASNLVCFGPWGYREPWKQWAAVTTHFFSIRDPPHTANLGFPPVTHLKYTCQGNSPWLASLPPTIRDVFPIPQLMLPCPPCGSPPPHDQIVGFSSSSSHSPPATGLPPRMMVRFTNIFNHSYCWSEQSTGRSLSSMQYQIYLDERYLSQEGCSIQTRSDHSSSWTIALQKDHEGNPWKNKH